MAQSTILETLAEHLQDVEQDPATPLDTELLEKCELYTNTPDFQTQVWQQTQPLFLQISSLLPQLQQDPSPLIQFVRKLASPYRFDDIKQIEFEIGLDLQAGPFHGLILSLLEKAAASSTDAQALANRPTVIQAVVRLWLCTPETGIATQAADLLVSLLTVSHNELEAPSPGHTHNYGAGPMWKRLFNDRDVTSLYYHYTFPKSLTTPAQPLLSKIDKTIAQARLLEWLPRVAALDWNTVVTSHAPAVETEVGLADGQGLLHYAALKMVDTADDILMHMTLINLFIELITTVKTSSPFTHQDSSRSLDLVKEHGIHKGIIDFHVTDSPSIEYSFLNSRTALYISKYATHYPENFEKSAEMQLVRNHIHRNIRTCDPHDLSILASMPRATLIPQRSGHLAWDECILLDVPIARTNADALKTLAAVLYGPPKFDLTFPEALMSDGNTKRTETEAVFARLLASLYYTKHTSMFSDIVTHTETIAMKENALAALNLLDAIITSSWSSAPLPDVIPENDAMFARLQNFPKTGVDLILDPKLSGGVLPSLLKPATTFSNVVGGNGDVENAAYQVAMLKFDVLNALGRRLEQDGSRQDVLAMVRRRVAEGPWGVGGGAGSRIGTLEL
ncbi:hypothetical protein BDV95DRAFT_594238 [Massariosphaeria phaeospora]|uniref:Uncharacterized protein n=1 Tax=Massariosphaeria phaeospora TaxID=100035 RepID=A0A7C8IB92_9PLEO|nr:hypothetical protein BDV95DRAFT_594238 [Massariosphaeria phaeospora]